MRRIYPRPAPGNRSKASQRRLAGLLGALPRGRHAVEFGHESWFAEDVLAILHDHDVALVLGDHPERTFQRNVPTALWRYLRFHHGARGRRGNYSQRELDEWARRIRRRRPKGDLYAYFNNDWEAFVPRNASDLKARLGAAGGA